MNQDKKIEFTLLKLMHKVDWILYTLETEILTKIASFRKSHPAKTVDEVFILDEAFIRKQERGQMAEEILAWLRCESVGSPDYIQEYRIREYIDTLKGGE